MSILHKTSKIFLIILLAFFGLIPDHLFAQQAGIKFLCITQGMVGFQDNYLGEIKPSKESEKFFLTYHPPLINGDDYVQVGYLSSEIFLSKIYKNYQAESFLDANPDYDSLSGLGVYGPKWMNTVTEQELGLNEPEDLRGQYETVFEWVSISGDFPSQEYNFSYRKAFGGDYLSKGKCTRIN